MTLKLETYDEGVTFVINEYAKDAKTVCLIEYGRGTKELAEALIENGYEVTVIDDFKQNIFSPPAGRYEGLKENMIEFNVLSSETAPDKKFDLIYTSIPHFVPSFPPEYFSPLVNDAFDKIKSMINKNGYLVTIDYNQPAIQDAILSNFDEESVTPLIETEDGEFYMAAIRNG